jgi:hypothetical protein
MDKKNIRCYFYKEIISCLISRILKIIKLELRNGAITSVKDIDIIKTLFVNQCLAFVLLLVTLSTFAGLSEQSMFFSKNTVSKYLL